MASGNLRGIPHLSNVTYFSPKRRNTGYIFVSACLGYFYPSSFIIVITLVIAFVLEVLDCII